MKPLISILTVTFNNETIIGNLLTSIANQSYDNWEIILVDNNSHDNTTLVTEEVCMRLNIKDRVGVFKLNSNTGFAFANNFGVKHAKGNYVLFVNSDVVLETNALEEMVATMLSKKSQKCVGVSPKMYLAKFLPEKVFDSVGICVDPTCSPYNRGIGQLDLGQYNSVERIMGCCFGCALIEKDTFQKLGGLDASYFAYFEDVDWCIRARKSGYEFYSAPKAVAYHDHSATSSKKSYGWKHQLIFQNYLRTVTKSLGKNSALKILPVKLKDLLITTFSKSSESSIRFSSAKVILNFVLLDCWRFFLYRKKTQTFFIPEVTDSSIFSFSQNEPSNFFNPHTISISNSSQMFVFIQKGIECKIPCSIASELRTYIKSYYCTTIQRRSEHQNKLLKSIELL